MTAKRVSCKVPNRVVAVILKRSQTLYDHFKERAKNLYMEVPFTLAEFRFWMEPMFDQDGAGRCEYSGEMILAENFQVDHRIPISRGGSFAIENLTLCSGKENLRKGNMSEVEYRQFKQHVERYAPEVQAAIWRKLEVGDVQRFGYFRRQKKLARQ